MNEFISWDFQTAHKNNLRKELIGRLDPREERPYERRKRQLPERRCVSLEAAVGYLLLEGSFLFFFNSRQVEVIFRFLSSSRLDKSLRKMEVEPQMKKEDNDYTSTAAGTKIPELACSRG